MIKTRINRWIHVGWVQHGTITTRTSAVENSDFLLCRNYCASVIMDLNWIYLVFQSFWNTFQSLLSKVILRGETKFPVCFEGKCRQQIVKSWRGFTADGPNVLPNNALNSILWGSMGNWMSSTERKMCGELWGTQGKLTAHQLGAVSLTELLIFGEHCELCKLTCLLCKLNVFLAI